MIHQFNNISSIVRDLPCNKLVNYLTLGVYYAVTKHICVKRNPNFPQHCSSLIKPAGLLVWLFSTVVDVKKHILSRSLIKVRFYFCTCINEFGSMVHLISLLFSFSSLSVVVGIPN